MPTLKVRPRTLAYYDDVSYTLSDARRINIFGEIGREMTSHIENSLTYMLLKSPKRPITMYMHTPGGSVIDGLAIYDSIMRKRKKTSIDIVVQGASMSMGVVILQAATKRYATPNSQFLLHEVSYGQRAHLSGQEDDLIQAKKLQETLDHIITARSGMAPAELKELINRRDYSISATEALKHNLIDAILE